MSEETKFSAAIKVITDMEINLEMTVKKKDSLINLVVAMAKALQKKDDIDYQEIINFLSKLDDISENPKELRRLLDLSKEYKDTDNEEFNNNCELLRKGLAGLLVASMHKSQKDCY